MKNGFLIVLGIGALLLLGSKAKSPAEKRKELVEYLSNKGDISAIDIVNTGMSDDEIVSSYAYIFDYVLKGKYPAAGSDLYDKIAIISRKYNVFT